jgi:hypothetical protein
MKQLKRLRMLAKRYGGNKRKRVCLGCYGKVCYGGKSTSGIIISMECHCNSKNLYRSDYSTPECTFSLEGAPSLRRRQIDPSLCAASHPHPALERKIEETAEMWVPSEIERISWDEITFNPLWFYKKFLSKNIPCVVTDVLEGDDIF